jgi:hypothetical protein
MSQSAILSVRVTPGERGLLEAAAAQARTSLSDFIRRKATDAAEIEVLDRSSIGNLVKDWAAWPFAWLTSEQAAFNPPQTFPCPTAHRIG